jgi:hypothetical protein
MAFARINFDFNKYIKYSNFQHFTEKGLEYGHEFLNSQRSFMKNLIFAMALTVVSFGAFAESRFEDSAGLGACGGEVQLRSYEDQNRGGTSYALKFNGVSNCSNVRLSTGKSYKLTDGNGNFQDKSFTLSDDAVYQAKSGGLSITVESNKGSTRSDVSVHIRDTYSPAPRPMPVPQEQPDYQSSGWN